MVPECLPVISMLLSERRSIHEVKDVSLITNPPDAVFLTLMTRHAREIRYLGFTLASLSKIDPHKVISRNQYMKLYCVRIYFMVHIGYI